LLRPVKDRENIEIRLIGGSGAGAVARNCRPQTPRTASLRPTAARVSTDDPAIDWRKGALKVSHWPLEQTRLRQFGGAAPITGVDRACCPRSLLRIRTMPAPETVAPGGHWNPPLLSADDARPQGTDIYNRPRAIRPNGRPDALMQDPHFAQVDKRFSCNARPYILVDRQYRSYGSHPL
jgi:hypothetical protein